MKKGRGSRKLSSSDYDVIRRVDSLHCSRWRECTVLEGVAESDYAKNYIRNRMNLLIEQTLKKEGFKIIKSKDSTIVAEKKYQISPFWIDIVDNEIEICRLNSGFGGGKVKKITLWKGEVHTEKEFKQILIKLFS